MPARSSPINYALSAGLVLLAAGASLHAAARNAAAVARRQSAASTVSTPAANQPAVSPRALIDQYCVSCHSERLKTAGVVLESRNPQADVFSSDYDHIRTQPSPSAFDRSSSGGSPPFRGCGRPVSGLE